MRLPIKVFEGGCSFAFIISQKRGPKEALVSQICSFYKILGNGAFLNNLSTIMLNAFRRNKNHYASSEEVRLNKAYAFSQA